MSPQQILNEMSLMGGCHVSISHGDDEEWGIRPDGGQAGQLREFGNASARISKKHSVVVEFHDPDQRNPVATDAALRRLRRFMERNGFVEHDVDQSPYGATATFISKAAAKNAAAKKPTATVAADERTALPNVSFQHGQQPATETQVRQIEKGFEFQFPMEYREFLLQHNGGIPDSPDIESGDADIGTIQITRFLSVKSTSDTSDEDSLQPAIEFQWGSLNLPESLIPIAIAEEDIVLLRVDGEDAGSVLLWYGISSGYEVENTLPLAGSFSEFLVKLSRDTAS